MRLRPTLISTPRDVRKTEVSGLVATVRKSMFVLENSSAYSDQ